MPFVKTGISTSLGEVKIKQADSKEVKESDEKKPEASTKEDK